MTNLALQLAESIKSFGVKAVYGETLEVEGTTVVPVAILAYGFGAGGSSEEADGDEGGYGAGGGGYTVPIGAYIGDTLGVRFQANPVALLVVGIPFVYVAGKALTSVIKALKK